MMGIVLKGGTICDPTQSPPLSQQDLRIDGDRVGSSPQFVRGDVIYDVSNCLIMAGAIDVHTHIGGGKANLTRLLLPSRMGSVASGPMGTEVPLSSPLPPTWETGLRYIDMGYTMAVEPAVVPCNARQAHLEMGATPYLDTAGLVLLGNEDLLLEAIQRQQGPEWVRDYVRAMVQGLGCLGVKVVNPGGINAFRFGVERSGLDDLHPRYQVSGRDILRALARSVDELGLPHPLHVHCNGLGEPGNITTTLATIEAVEGYRMHLAHAQFHAYGDDGPHGFSSAAAALADAVNGNPQITLDVGQVLFGQTATISADIDHQYRSRKRATPRKTIFQTTECQSACGVVPFRYRESQYVHALQWTIGLELLLRIDDPFRVFLTTDHPNGGPFTAYPHLLHLLSSYDRRMECFERLHPDVRKSSPLPQLKREYSLAEIAAMTRVGPANVLGLSQLGRLSPGSLADVIVYDQSRSVDAMFRRPKMVFRRGRLIVQDGRRTEDAMASMLNSTAKHTWMALDSDPNSLPPAFLRRWKAWHGRSWACSTIARDEFPEHLGSGTSLADSPRTRAPSDDSTAASKTHGGQP